MNINDCMIMFNSVLLLKKNKPGFKIKGRNGIDVFKDSRINIKCMIIDIATNNK